MKIKIAQALALIFAVMGFAHVVATFHPLFAGKFESLPAEQYAEFTYISIVFGLFHILCGAVLFSILPKIHQDISLKRLYAAIIIALLVDGIVAAIFMRHDPSALSLIFLLTPLSVLSCKK